MHIERTGKGIFRHLLGVTFSPKIVSGKQLTVDKMTAEKYTYSSAQFPSVYSNDIPYALTRTSLPIVFVWGIGLHAGFDNLSTL